jgi:hypothetical protein
MSRDASKEWRFHHTRNYSTQLVKWWPASCRRLWLPCLTIEWRDWKGSLRTMVITIHKLSAWSFTFLQYLSETGSLNLSGTPYISLRYSSHCHNGAELKQRTTSENCWRIRIMRARIPPGYQLNILTRIEWNQCHILQIPYSPDLAPSDFYLFGYVKRCLAGLSFADADQLLAAVEGIVKVTLQAVFLEWMDWFRKYITANGEYTEQAQISVIEEWSFILPISRYSCPGGTPCMWVRPIILGCPKNEYECDWDIMLCSLCVWDELFGLYHSCDTPSTSCTAFVNSSLRTYATLALFFSPTRLSNKNVAWMNCDEKTVALILTWTSCLGRSIAICPIESQLRKIILHHMYSTSYGKRGHSFNFLRLLLAAVLRGPLRCRQIGTMKIFLMDEPTLIITF